MVEEANFAFRLMKTDETRNFLLDEIKRNDSMSENYKNTCKYLNYVEQLLILVSTVTGCFSIFTFTSLVVIPVGITSSAVEKKIYATITRIKKHKSIIKNKKKKHDKIVFFGKGKLNTIEVIRL